ncbi:RNA polymerase sigma factor [Roseimarinus sediminis]|uniref:RNA polymerase sigma factor n=1 Tax=Roseimarinus sediminis TaxID=1610899 RepID=UPI003D225C17
MASYSNEELLRGILRNNSTILRHIYKSYYHMINAFVIRNKGDESNANDIFQEAIIVIYRKLKSDRLMIETCTFETYLYSVARLLWLKQLERRKNDIVKVEEVHHFSDQIYDDELVELARKNDRYRLFQEHFQKLGKDCKQILQLFFDKLTFKQIADTLGYTSESYAKKRKHQCKEYLVRSIKQDEEFKKIIENDY